MTRNDTRATIDTRDAVHTLSFEQMFDLGMISWDGDSPVWTV